MSQANPMMGAQNALAQAAQNAGGAAAAQNAAMAGAQALKGSVAAPPTVYSSNVPSMGGGNLAAPFNELLRAKMGANRDAQRHQYRMKEIDTNQVNALAAKEADTAEAIKLRDDADRRAIERDEYIDEKNRKLKEEADREAELNVITNDAVNNLSRTKAQTRARLDELKDLSRGGGDLTGTPLEFLTPAQQEDFLSNAETRLENMPTIGDVINAGREARGLEPIDAQSIYDAAGFTRPGSDVGPTGVEALLEQSEYGPPTPDPNIMDGELGYTAPVDEQIVNVTRARNHTGSLLRELNKVTARRLNDVAGIRKSVTSWQDLVTKLEGDSIRDASKMAAMGHAFGLQHLPPDERGEGMYQFNLPVFAGQYVDQVQDKANKTPQERSLGAVKGLGKTILSFTHTTTPEATEELVAQGKEIGWDPMAIALGTELATQMYLAARKQVETATTPEDKKMWVDQRDLHEHEMNVLKAFGGAQDYFTENYARVELLNNGRQIVANLKADPGNPENLRLLQELTAKAVGDPNFARNIPKIFDPNTAREAAEDFWGTADSPLGPTPSFEQGREAAAALTGDPYQDMTMGMSPADALQSLPTSTQGLDAAPEIAPPVEEPVPQMTPEEIERSIHDMVMRGGGM